MLISVDHTTHYKYEETAHYIAQRLRLTPLSSPLQTVREWEIEMPGIESAVSYLDGLSNMTFLVTNQGNFDSISLRARGLVETHNVSGVLGEDASGLLPGIFLRTTDYTRADKALQSFARKIENGDQVPFLHRVMAAIHETIAYDSDATHALTTASDAFRQRRGVCQDHSHIFISIARLHNIPARYVTGYLLVNAGGSPEIAQHAWTEAYINNLGWVGFDPANCVSPNEHYIRLACGFDALSASPISGIRRGGGGEQLDVSLDVSEIQQQ